MKKPELSIVFDSGIEFLDGDTFDEIIMAEFELFSKPEFESICDELNAWDVKSLHEIRESLFTYLQTRQGAGVTQPPQKGEQNHAMQLRLPRTKRP